MDMSVGVQLSHGWNQPRNSQCDMGKWFHEMELQGLTFTFSSFLAVLKQKSSGLCMLLCPNIPWTSLNWINKVDNRGWDWELTDLIYTLWMKAKVGSGSNAGIIIAVFLAFPLGFCFGVRPSQPVFEFFLESSFFYGNKDITHDFNSQYFWKWTNVNPMKFEIPFGGTRLGFV